MEACKELSSLAKEVVLPNMKGILRKIHNTDAPPIFRTTFIEISILKIAESI